MALEGFWCRPLGKCVGIVLLKNPDNFLDFQIVLRYNHYNNYTLHADGCQQKANIESKKPSTQNIAPRKMEISFVSFMLRDILLITVRTPMYKNAFIINSPA